MKVTIDSSESLESAIRVLGAMYDVTLTVATEAASPVQKSRTTRKASSSSSAKRVRTAKPKGAAASTKGPVRPSGMTAASVSASELRSWARANGYEVSNHGRLPGTLAKAYHEAHRN